MAPKAKGKPIGTDVLSQVRKLKKSKEISSWFNAFSNNMLPPILFLSIATIALYFIPQVNSLALRANLALIAAASTALSLYIITLMV